MAQLIKPAVGKSGLDNPIHVLLDMVKRRARKNRNLTELKKLNPVFLEDIGLFEYTRAQIVREG
jgi:hypothetical protein